MIYMAHCQYLMLFVDISCSLFYNCFAVLFKNYLIKLTLHNCTGEQNNLLTCLHRLRAAIISTKIFRFPY